MPSANEGTERTTRKASSKAGEHEVVWGAKEMSILYGPPTSVPFDDLDVIVKHSLRIATVDGESFYPSAVVFRHGTRQARLM
ncbi:hypothetical protein PsorP6_005039 [Peronosclerospora sorghi]|uniref:Uncharacterized protein n=1 Tax=Peronosclerospora sorghi TaxID=230839 RepID=A0ACC0W3B7_9STRA|nr:hypothetical protein PsorP6_005039 [Peronosclerospora sorghi]